MSELSRGFIEALRSGALDGDLQDIVNAANQRRFLTLGQTPTAAVIGSYMPGDRVVTSDTIRPQYLQRRPGTLVRLKLKRWAFKPDDPTPWGRFLHPDGTTGLLPSQFRKETP